MITANKYLDSLKKTIDEIDVIGAFDNSKARNGLLIDIRERHEITSGSPTGCLRIPKGLLEMQIQHHAKDEKTPIHLICASGRRSLIAAFSLKQMGYKNVYSVKGGFNDWKNKELPFEKPKVLNPSDQERYKRHLLISEIGEKGQLKLLESKVLIVGAGGIGSPVAWYLAGAGIGHIGIIDNDVVDKTNLQRQILHTEKSVGSSKVDSAKERLTNLNSDIHIETYNGRLTEKNVESIISNYDLVLDGTDNFTTRYLINDACVKLKKPNVHGSVFRFEGQMSTFWPASQNSNTPCYRCLYPVPPPPELAPSCAEAGVLGVLPGIVGVLCAAEAIKILVGFGDLMTGKLLCFNALTWSFDTYQVEQKKDCPYCSCEDNSKYPEYHMYETYCQV